MKNFQDTETGAIYSFEDGNNPFELNNRNIPTTLSETVILKPSESHVWFNGDWASISKVPIDYKPPISSVPSYNPAWASFLKPYTAILTDSEDGLEVLPEQINSNSYDESKLSKAVLTLSLTNSEHIDALVSYDGAIAIPRNADYPSVDIAIEKLNCIFCAILLGGLHAEVISSSELVSAFLENNEDIFVCIPSIHTRFRHKNASIGERIMLMQPRLIRISELKDAYQHGCSVIDAVSNFSPFFLLDGYTAMIHQNRSLALSSLWIVVEQLTSFLWDERFLATNKFHPVKKNKSRLESLKQDNRTWTTSVKHELLWQTKILSESCFAALSAARQQRNKLVHNGVIPSFEVIENLWQNMHELFESASNISPIKMRQLAPFKVPDLGITKNYNFDEWVNLSKSL